MSKHQIRMQEHLYEIHQINCFDLIIHAYMRK